MKILVIGGDKRMIFAAQELRADTLLLGKHTDINGKYDAIVLPMPLTRDGENVFCPLENTAFPFLRTQEFCKSGAVVFAGGSCPKLTEICLLNSFKLINYSEVETLTLKNAALTAENAVMLMVQSSEGSLFGSSVLVTGYGRIAKFLAGFLKPFNCKLTIAARRPEARVQAELDGLRAIDTGEIAETIGEYDYIANTAPAQLFFESSLSACRKETVFLELATLPQEPTKSLCEKSGVKYVFAGGLPGKYSPKAAGKVIAEEIKKFIS